MNGFPVDSTPPGDAGRKELSNTTRRMPSGCYLGDRYELGCSSFIKPSETRSTADSELENSMKLEALLCKTRIQT